MVRYSLILSLALICAACGPKQPATANDQVDVAQADAPDANLPDPATIKPGEPGGLPDDRTPVAEGPIDPKSGQGAGQVLQLFGGLL